MKKKLLAKKTLSVFMAVLMLMSAWVFFPGMVTFEASAASTITGNYNSSLVNSISFNNNVTTITDLNWAYNGDNQENEPNVYKNILYSSDCSGVTANTGSVNLKDSGAATIQWYHGATTFLYDGVTTPQTGVMVACIPKGSSYNIRTYSSYIVSGNGLSLPHMWYAYDGRANFMYVITAPRNTGAATADGSVNGTNAWTVNSNTWYANELQFTGSLGTNEYYRDITVRWGWKGNQKSQGTGNVYTYEATSGNHIYVINWKVLKDAYAKAQEYVNVVKANPDRYSTASVKNLKSICDALIAAHPNNYVNVSKNDPSGYGTAASNAISRLNSFSFSDKTVDVTFENLFSLSDWANSQSFEFDSSKGEVTVENNNTIKIYKSISGGEITTGSSYSGNHSANRYSIPVTGGKKYTVKYDIANTSVNGLIKSEVFLFWYKSNGTPASTALNNGAFEGEGTHKVTFTAPTDAAYAEIRFDNDCPTNASTIRFKNIAVYDADRAAEIDLENWGAFAVTKPYAYQAVLGTTYDVPTRNGYTFNGWYLDSNGNGVKDAGEEVTDAEGTIVSNLQSYKADVHYNLYADWKQLPIDVGYDNMFSLANWALTGSVKPNDANRGTITYDVMAGTITAAADADTGDGEIYSTYNADGYTITVKPNTEYVFSAKMTTPSGSANKYGQMFIFCYDANGNGVNGPTEIRADGTESTASGQHIGIYPTTDGVHTIKFRTPADCYKLRIRVGATDNGVTEVYSDIGVYEKAVYDAYAKNYAVVRVPFEVGDTTALTLNPTRDGYEFDGWYTAGGAKVTDVSGFTASDIIYAHWIQKFTVTFQNYDGTVIKTEEVAPGKAATAPSAPGKDPDDNYEYVFAAWDTDAYKNVQSDLVVKATYSTKAHENISYTRIKAADCEKPGEITKTCDACGYAWHDGNSFPDTTGEFAPALGHNYVTVVTGSSTGVDGTHKLACNRNNCKYGENGGPATITAAHNFVLDKDHPASDATCTVAGETYYKCACLEVKTETGTTNPNNHVNTEIRDDVAAECEKPGYTGDTWCLDCNTKIKTGSATEALEHVYTTYIYNDDAKCGVDGTETATCDLCGIKTDTRDKEGSALEHKYTTYTYNNDAKCEVDGTKTASCDHGCGTIDTITATGTALVHDYTGAHKSNNDGTHEFLCKNGCGSYGGTVNCGYGAWTKDNAATHSHTCTTCGYTPAAEAHTWSAWTTVGGSATEKATQTRSCTVCGREESTDCNYTVKDHKDATCEAPEITTYECSDCKHGYSVIGESAKGHNFTKESGVKNNGNGTHSFACVNGCGEYGFGTTKNMSVPCSDWTYANTEAGKHTATCDDCGYVKTENCSGGEATCTAKAVCQFCNTAYGEKAPHSYTGNTYFDGVEKAKDATCTAQAEYYTYCEFCKVTSKGTDKEATFAYGDFLPHTFTGNTEFLYKATDAECEVNETYYVYCSACKASSKDTDEEATFEKPDTALEHVWVNAQHNADTLTHTFTCERGCGQTMEASCMDSAVNFDFELATCTSQGYDIVQCSACNHTWNINYTDALGHDYTKKIYKDDYLKEAANCEHENIYYYACSRCERSAEEVTEDEVYTGTGSLTFLNGEVREHDFHNKVDAKYLADEATCFAAAKYFTSCKYEDCGKSSEEVNGVGKGTKFSSGTALAHDWTEVEDAKYLATKADCANDATYYYECSLCKKSSKDYGDGATWTDVDSKSGHSMTYTAAKAATCYEAGNLEYWYCSTCKKYFKDAEGNEEYLGQSATVIRKREHDLESFSFKAATCEEDGHPAYVDCKYEDCDYTTLPAVLPDGYKAIGHNFTGAWTYDEVHLYHSKLCANGCGKSGMVIDGVQTEYKVELDVIDYVITGGEKCDFTYKAETKDGVHTHANSCVCGNGNTRVYSDEETFVETVAPTCTTKGYDSYACPEEDCDDTWTKNEVAALNHLPAEKATSNGDGTHSVYCTREGCGYKISTEKCSGGTATCKDKAVCEKCGDAYGETSDHTFTAEWVYQNDATCGVNGTEKNTCDVCNTEVSREAKDTALEHKVSEYVYELPEGVTIKDFDASALKEPTCKEDGFAVRYCTLGCGYYQTKTVAKDNNAHIWETDENGELVWKDHQGDCATGVTMKNYCTVCGKEQKKTEAGEHKWEIKLFAEPNCVDKGYRVWRCSTCKFTFDEFYGYKGEYLAQIEALGYSNEDLAPLGEEGHSYINTGKNKPATCTEGEKETWQCVHCDEYDYRDIEGAEELGHKLNHYDAQAADCVFEGNVEYYRCTRCDLMFADENATETLTTVTVPTTDHADNDGDGKCDECYRVIYSNEDGEGSCGCICHKENFLMRILYKILNFFWKLFKISKTCECGAVHW